MYIRPNRIQKDSLIDKRNHKRVANNSLEMYRKLKIFIINFSLFIIVITVRKKKWLPHSQLLGVERAESVWRVERGSSHSVEKEQSYLEALSQPNQNIMTVRREQLNLLTQTTQTSCFGMRASLTCPVESESFSDVVSCSLRIEWQFIILLQPFSVDSEPLSSG